MSRRGLVLAACLAGGCIFGGGAFAGTVALPSTGMPLTSAPPLLSGISQQISPIFRGHLGSRTHVTARIDPAGAVHRVDVLQRIVVPKGDFFFSVAAPATDVRGLGRSEPGLRHNAILWQGFSPGHRVLGSVANLRLGQSAQHLPVGISVQGARRNGPLDLRVRIADRTGVSAPAFSAPASRHDLATLLDQLRHVKVGNRGFAPFLAVGTPLRKVKIPVRVPLLVRGTISLPGRRLEDGQVTGGTLAKGPEGVRIRVARVLSDGHPPNLTVRLRGNALGAKPPKIDLSVVPLAPKRSLSPPGGGTWVSALRRGQAPSARAMLARANSALLALALAGQYENFVANPDPNGSTRTSYRYVSGAPTAVQPSPLAPTEQGGGSAPWGLLAFGLAAVVTAAVLAVFWAHS